MAEAPRDYLAVIDIGGAGSWYRGPDREKAIKNAISTFRRDFKNYFKLEKGKPVKVNVLDVTGNDKVWWDCLGFHGDNKDAPMKLEVIDRTL